MRFLTRISMGFLLVLISSECILGKLPPTDKKYKILMLLPFASTSHRNVFLPIADELADRGHKVVIVCSLKSVRNHPNILEMDLPIKSIDEEGNNMFEVRKNSTLGGPTVKFQELLPVLARELYKLPEYKKLYERKHEFDVVMVDGAFNEVAYPYTHERPFIAVATPGKTPKWSAILGNVLNPAFVPSFIEFKRPYSFYNKMTNLLKSMLYPIMWNRYVLPLVQKELDVHFPNLPRIQELERNVSLVLMNGHFSLDVASPNMPNEIEVGGMHCKPTKPLPEDFKKWIEEAEHGVVYFSLGSVTKGSFMPEEYKKIFINAFKRIKQRVIWKFEEDISGLSDNVMKRTWLPQQDILGHPNVKLFISHGGGLSYQEAVYHATPLISIPIFGDQPKNAQLVENNGFGHQLVWETMTEEKLINAIEDIVNNPKYQENINAASKTFKDQPMLPADLAVWWTEYIARHKGAPNLRSPGADIGWIEYLMIDILILAHLLLYILYFAVKKLFSLCTNTKRPKKQKMN